MNYAFSERAAIREYDGKQPRADAELGAAVDHLAFDQARCFGIHRASGNKCPVRENCLRFRVLHAAKAPHTPYIEFCRDRASFIEVTE